MIQNATRRREVVWLHAGRASVVSSLHLLAVLPLIVLGLVSTARSEQPTARSGERLRFEGAILSEHVRPHVEYLASPELKGRSGREAAVAARYLVDKFQSWGVRPLFEDDSYFQPIPGMDGPDGQRGIVGRNVGGWIPGDDPQLRDEIIIISAHYDHLGVRNGRIYAGADDNASGVSMMLEVARQISQQKTKPRRSVVFVGFDLEERMLWGSRWFAAHPPWPLERVKLFITADMIGRSLGNLDLPAVFVMGSEHAPRLKTALDEIGTPHGLETARLGIDLIGTRSDYGPFRDRKVPFLFFSTGEHPDYHTPRDVPERIDYDKVARVSSLVLQLCRHIADSDAPPVWTDELKPDLDEARTLHRVTTLLLEADDAQLEMDSDDGRRLTDLQRLVVSQAQIRTRQILERGEMTASERTWLVQLSRLLLLSVF
jgi:hypothetical protein